MAHDPCGAAQSGSQSARAQRLHRHLVTFRRAVRESEQRHTPSLHNSAIPTCVRWHAGRTALDRGIRPATDRSLIMLEKTFAVLCALAYFATPAFAQRNDPQVLRDISTQVTRYTQFTIFDN